MYANNYNITITQSQIKNNITITQPQNNNSITITQSQNKLKHSHKTGSESVELTSSVYIINKLTCHFNIDLIMCDNISY